MPLDATVGLLDWERLSLDTCALLSRPFKLPRLLKVVGDKKKVGDRTVARA